MGQKAVEMLLGRLITDGDFRTRFYDQPAAACLHERLDITTRELEALLNIEQDALHAFARHLDPRIVRATVASSQRRAASAPAQVKKQAARSG
jgi:hypothetical protein